METRAHHVMIGLFSVIVVVGAMLFGLWLAKSSVDTAFQDYEVIFNEAVSGLSQGSSVQYSGIKVGDVISLSLDPKDPRRVLARIRLSGQGEGGGNLYLNLRVAPHPVFQLNGQDLDLTLPITPWEAVLGAKVHIPTLEGTASLTLPPGTQGGARLRLSGKGLPDKSGARGDIFVNIRIAIPDHPTPREKELFEQLAKESTFRPRPR